MAILHTISSAPLRPALASPRVYHGTISSPVLNVENRRRSFPVLQLSIQNSNLRMEAMVDHKSAGDVHHVRDVDDKPTDDCDVCRLIDSISTFVSFDTIADYEASADGDYDPKNFPVPDEIPFQFSWNPDSSIRLVREYKGESIQVNAKGGWGLVYFSVKISKGSQYNLYFSAEIRCDDGWFEIDTFEMRGGEALKAVEKYLENNGLTRSATNVLLNCIERKLKKS